jgi:hypothetical protein
VAVTGRTYGHPQQHQQRLQPPQPPARRQRPPQPPGEEGGRGPRRQRDVRRRAHGLRPRPGRWAGSGCRCGLGFRGVVVRRIGGLAGRLTRRWRQRGSASTGSTSTGSTSTTSTGTCTSTTSTCSSGGGGGGSSTGGGGGWRGRTTNGRSAGAGAACFHARY